MGGALGVSRQGLGIVEIVESSSMVEHICAVVVYHSVLYMYMLNTECLCRYNYLLY